MRIHNDPSKFGRIPDPPEPPSDEWFEEHCPRCKHNHEWEEDGKWFAECTQGGCTGFEEIDELCAECECRYEKKRGWQ